MCIDESGAFCVVFACVPVLLPISAVGFKDRVCIWPPDATDCVCSSVRSPEVDTDFLPATEVVVLTTLCVSPSGCFARSVVVSVFPFWLILEETAVVCAVNN